MKLVIFGQDIENCGPCKLYEPVVKKLIAEGYTVERHEAFTPEGEHNPLNAEYGVDRTPTTIIYDDDVEVHRFVGARPFSFVTDLLKD